MWSRINRFAKRNVYTMGALVMGSRYMGGDAAVQALNGWQNGSLKKDWLDVQRSVAFLSFGTGFSPMMTMLYTKVYPRVLGLSRPMLTAFVDCTTHGPMLYFPAFYMVKEFAFADLNEAMADPLTVARRGLSNYASNFWSDMQLYFSVWIPLHFLNFKFFPRTWAMPVMAVQGLIWVGVLSMFRGQKAEDADADADAIADAEPATSLANVSVSVTHSHIPHHAVQFVAPHMQQAKEAAQTVARMQQARSRPIADL